MRVKYNYIFRIAFCKVNKKYSLQSALNLTVQGPISLRNGQCSFRAETEAWSATAVPPQVRPRVVDCSFLFPLKLNLSFPAFYISVWLPSSTFFTPHTHHPFLMYKGLSWPMCIMGIDWPIHPSLNEEQIQLQVL